jgi:uncharacterized domain HDIG
MNDIENRALEFFGNVHPAHDWFHVKRVENIALELAEKEGADRKIVQASVLLHDIGRKKEDENEIEDHAVWGSKKAEEILEELDYDDEFIEKVKECIETHRYSRGPDPESIEAKVLSDADNLDALGATGIARTFSYGGEYERVIANPSLPAEEDPDESGSNSFNHLQKKILKLKNRMYTDSGLEIAEERHNFVKEYVERFKDEMKGKK